MATFGNSLIERLRARLVDVQPQNQLGLGSIVLGEKLNIMCNAKRGVRKSRLPYSSSSPVVAQVANDGVSFDGSEHLRTLG